MISVARRLLLALVALSFVLVAMPEEAEARLAFFRNYPDVKWRVIKTEHFNVFYPVTKKMEGAKHPVDAEFTARKTAYIAEEMYPLVCGQFNYYLDETVNIVMLDQTDSLTGYTVPNFDWIVVSGRHSDNLWRLRGHHDWLRNVIYHEFGHVVSLKADQPLAEESFGSVIGVRWRDGRVNTVADASVFAGTGDPWFWVEGGAEYYTDVAGINNWTANRDMRMRMDILEGTSLNFGDMQDYYGSHGGFDGNRHYLSGYSFALYLEERFGEGVYQSFALKRSEQGWSPNWLGVIEDVLNVSADDLYEDWQAWAKEKYQKVADKVMEDPAEGTPMWLKKSYWASDKPSDAEHEAWLKSLRGGNKYKWRRDRERGDGQFYNNAARFSPDGSKWGHYELIGGAVNIQFTPEEAYPALNADAELLVGDDLSDKLRKRMSKKLTLRGTGDGQFDFSPDGNKVVYPCNEDMATSKAALKTPGFAVKTWDMDGYNWHHLCIGDLAAMEAKGRELMLEHFEGHDPMAEDDEHFEMWKRGYKAPDTVHEDRKGKKWERRHWLDWVNAEYVNRMDPYVTMVPGDNRRLSDPAWSPDGGRIAYVRYNDGTQNIWVIDPDTGEGGPITNFTDGTRIEALDWSPDGTQLVSGLFRWNQQDLYVFEADGSGGRALTGDRFEDRDVHWGHDGNIYFTSDRVDGIFNVFRINPRVEPGRFDADLDGVVDTEDACPDEPETRNLFRDNDGCPDSVPIRVTKDRIEIDEKIFFELDSDVIKGESHELVRAIARVMVSNPQIIKVEIGGHTDSQGDGEYNLELSQRRAQSVVNFLLAEGVTEERLEAKGYGLTVPLVDEETQEAFAKNRRVELLILEQEEVTEVVEAPVEEEPEVASSCAEDADRLSNAYLVQVTNVVSGAFWPNFTPAGNLLYEHYSPFGWEPHGLSCGNFHNKVVDDTSLVINTADFPLDVEQEVYPDYSAVTQDVKVHGAWVRNPMIIPIINVGNVSLSHLGVDLAIYFAISDALDTNNVWAYAQAGEDVVIQMGYRNTSGFATFNAFGLFRMIKSDFGFLLDEDQNSTTTDDQFLADQKLTYFIYGGGAGVTLPFSQLFDVSLSTFQYALAVQGVDDGKKLQPIRYRGIQDVTIRLFSQGLARNLLWDRLRINPRGGRGITFQWQPNFTVPLNSASGGVDVDDGQVFNSYFYNRFDLTWTEYLALPIKNRVGDNAGHTLQVEFQASAIDRNVPFADEIRGGGAGGLNRTNPLTSNSVFAGYEPFSLSGETAALLNLQYRFPLVKDIDKKLGILYIDSIYLQFFGTVGNFWSYRVKSEGTTNLFGENVLTDPVARVGGSHDRPGDGVVREVPGMLASENGNYVLADAGVEVRLAANLFNRSNWNSFFRIAYGFMPVSGRGDVNGDDVFTNGADPTLDNRASESEPSGLRFYLGIGTGW
ncbi:MAG: OmpA family protein [Deltaproteobacteria bacterium]|nr:OmpA family protein [Deltaproteobacteria bacterium]